MNEDTLIHEIAMDLYDAQKEKKPIPSIVDTQAIDLSLDQAYRVQEALIQLKRIHGSRVLAPKLGLTSEAKMTQMGVNQPIYGYIFADGSVGDTIVVDNYIHPKIEAEIVVTLAKDMMGPVTAEDVAKNVSAILSGVEIIDSRYEDFKFQLQDVVADNASASGYYLSNQEFSLMDVDVEKETAQILVNGEVVSNGQGSNVLGSPINALVSLINQLAKRGESVKAGQPILTGALGQAVTLNSGDSIQVQFKNLESLHFTVK
jgi:2-oxo-3-hexenedioate decarboxylase